MSRLLISDASATVSLRCRGALFALSDTVEPHCEAEKVALHLWPPLKLSAG